MAVPVSARAMIAAMEIKEGGMAPDTLSRIVNMSFRPKLVD